ncbi:hypothetical protein PACILC2_26480 [Paenibacillus cisolokensis]|uniref:YetF C-terminal domain-containing protein n=1 Tax=Paenibacillus cisolokensis TaxID=1658519 RepID=A0ABQ4N759_9BACL|nr:DUF421 domain-containing protein [Paenibacillus cisolokensis]GIQ64080.1 hypothetical protein PACILC2_26480 [Paenibacillus cisolokensis]
MEYLLLLFRTLVIYFVVFLTVRLMGKREIGKLSVFDLIISFMIAEIAVIVIEDVKRPIWDGVLPMALLVAIQIATAFLALKSRTVRRLLDGKPSVIIAKGQLNREAMRKERYNIDDLTSQLRENQLSSPDDVEFAILETNGKLSIVKKTRMKMRNKTHRFRIVKNRAAAGRRLSRWRRPTCSVSSRCRSA